MKKTEIISLSFLVAILAISGISLYLLISPQEEMPQNNKEMEALQSKSLITDFYIKQFTGESVMNNGLSVDLSNKEYTDANGKGYAAKDKPVLVYRYSALSCNACVEFGIEKLKEHFDDYNNNDDLLFVISDYPEKQKIKHTYYLNLKKNNLKLPLESTNIPFYFVLIDNRVEHVFIPDREFSDYANIYFKEIKKRYFNK